MSATVGSTPADDGDFHHEPVLEGFLCPICKADLKTPDLLTAHVDAAHSEQDQALVRSFRGMLLSAKQKLRNEFTTGASSTTHSNNDGSQRDGSPSSSASSSSTSAAAAAGASPPHPVRHTSAYPPIFCRRPAEPQLIGADMEHTAYFKSVRAVRLERYATETNKLLIRLHKLLNVRLVPAAQRRQLEQHLVPWMDGKLVRLCPGCAKRFLLTRRQHHCRLCGSIMCGDCSRFLDLRLAAELVNPMVDASPADAPDNTDNADAISQRSERTESDGMAATAAAEDGDEAAPATLRCCSHCLHLLGTRQDQLESRTLRPPICALYERMARVKVNVRPDCVAYAKVVASLLSGDTVFQLADAGALRARVGHAAKQLDALSETLLQQPAAKGSQAERLQQSVRLACVEYIREQMLGLEQLPAAEVVEERQRRRREEAEQRIERERRLALEEWERRAAAAAAAANAAGRTEAAEADETTAAQRRRNGKNGAASSGVSVDSRLDSKCGPDYSLFHAVRRHVAGQLVRPTAAAAAAAATPRQPDGRSRRADQQHQGLHSAGARGAPLRGGRNAGAQFARAPARVLRAPARGRPHGVSE